MLNRIKRNKNCGCMVCILILIMLTGCSEDSAEVFGLDSLDGPGISAEAVDGSMEDIAAEGSSHEEEPPLIYVFVCGAVLRPGVVALPEGSRAEAGVLAAGGMREDADADYVNLAALLTDGEKLYIPTLEEGTALKQADAAGGGLVNINTADSGLLCTLPGIGESRAADIIAYREQNGAFAGIEDIMKVPGIKESVFEKLKALITV